MVLPNQILFFFYPFANDETDDKHLLTSKNTKIFTLGHKNTKHYIRNVILNFLPILLYIMHDVLFIYFVCITL